MSKHNGVEKAGGAAATEGGRRPTGVAAAGAAASGPVVRDVEVRSKPRRRFFSAEYKRGILRRVEAIKARGDVGGIGELLRVEGLYSSHLTTWREEAERGELAALSGKKCGRKPKGEKETLRKIEHLEREVRTLRTRAERAEALVEIQKKVSDLLGIPLPEPDEER
jgi:transposase-like protein